MGGLGGWGGQWEHERNMKGTCVNKLKAECFEKYFAKPSLERRHPFQQMKKKGWHK
jgi:hypothetical protein